MFTLKHLKANFHLLKLLKIHFRSKGPAFSSLEGQNCTYECVTWKLRTISVILLREKYVIVFSPNSRWFSGSPDKYLSICLIYCKTSSWNSRGCNMGTVGKSGVIFLTYPSTELYWPTAYVQRRYPALQLDQRGEILDVRPAQRLLRVAFASWILLSLVSGLISGIKCWTIKWSKGASCSGQLRHTKQFSL